MTFLMSRLLHFVAAYWAKRGITTVITGPHYASTPDGQTARREWKAVPRGTKNENL
jgi:hypothetical protein